MSEISFENANRILENFNEEVTAFIKDNDLSDIPEYSKLQTKEAIGGIYRHDQVYFEKVSSFKSNYFGINSFFLKMKTESKSDRILTKKIESVVEHIDQKIKMMDTLVSKAKQRLKFFESMIYLISNMSYGDY